MIRILIAAVAVTMSFTISASAGMLDGIKVLKTKSVNPVVTSTLRADELEQQMKDRHEQYKRSYLDDYIVVEGEIFDEVQERSNRCSSMKGVIQAAFPFVMGKSMPTWTQLDEWNVRLNNLAATTIEKHQILEDRLEEAGTYLPPKKLYTLLMECLSYVHQEVNGAGYDLLVIHTDDGDYVITRNRDRISVVTWKSLRESGLAGTYKTLKYSRVEWDVLEQGQPYMHMVGGPIANNGTLEVSSN